jgi:hypothetical protein
VVRDSLKYERMFGLESLQVELEKLVASEIPADPGELFRLKAVMEYAWTRACEQYDRSGTWQVEGFASAGAALRVKCGLKQGVANRAISLGRKLRSLPEAEFAWSQGEITGEHVQVIANAYTPVRDAELRDLDLERAFVDAAKSTDPKTLGDVVRYATDQIDGDGGATDADLKRQRRRFHMSRTLDGMWIGDFLLDDEDGRTVKHAIDKMRGNYERAETRSPEQQRADALVELCMVGVDHLPDGVGHVQADIAVQIDLSDVEARGGGDLAAEIRALKRAPLPRAILERLCCDARFSRVLTDGPSQVLDVGRATRKWTAAQRKFIVARDGGCVDCGAPAEWCQIHHEHNWEHGGETNVDNGKLKCRPCHIKTHQNPRRGPP